MDSSYGHLSAAAADSQELAADLYRSGNAHVRALLGGRCSPRHPAEDDVGT
ncbi:hypothetical protein [Streptomyces virginiae]